MDVRGADLQEACSRLMANLLCNICQEESFDLLTFWGGSRKHSTTSDREMCSRLRMVLSAPNMAHQSTGKTLTNCNIVWRTMILLSSL
jgi:hypothetical protein